MLLIILLILSYLLNPQARNLSNESDGADDYGEAAGYDEVAGYDVGDRDVIDASADANGPVKGAGFSFLISGGHIDKDITQHSKYIVSIRSRIPELLFGDNHMCAGTIIRISTIVTAAHCVMNHYKVTRRPRDLLIVAGTPNRISAEASTQQYPVLSIRVHPNYIVMNTNDIAVLRIKGGIPDNSETIQRLKLPTAPISYDHLCTAVGWGRLYERGPLASQPLHTTIYLKHPDDCANKTRFYKKNVGMLCGSDLGAPGNTCRGDEGGPLICNNAFSGVISWPVGCGSTTIPSIFTDVFPNIDWINGSARPEGVLVYILLGIIYACIFN